METTSSKTLGENIAATVSLLEGRLAQIEALIEPLIAEDARLSRNRELLMSIPGIGKTIATRLLAELPAIDSFASVRQMCAYAARASERHVGQRPQPHVQTRRSGLRELLFMPA